MKPRSLLALLFLFVIGLVVASWAARPGPWREDVFPAPQAQTTMVSCECHATDPQTGWCTDGLAIVPDYQDCMAVCCSGLIGYLQKYCAPGPCPPATPTPTPTPRPPVLDMAVACDVWGNAGWCRANGRIEAQGTDPEGGGITVTGTTGGAAPQSLNCSGTGTCTAAANLPPGTGTASAQAVSAGGTTSASLAWKFDPESPTLNFTLSPPSPDGANGWYVNPVTVTVSGNDTVSGVASKEVSLDGGAWAPSPVTVGDGVHALRLRVRDRAGNETVQDGPTVRVDTTPPTLTLHMDPAAPDGANGWYVTAPVVVEAVAADTTSGLASVQCRVDGGTWTNSPVSVNGDGVHVVECRAEDTAGNTATTSVQVRIDGAPPVASWDAPPPDGANGWFVSTPVHVNVAASDATSGVAQVQIRIDGGAWQTPPLVLNADGIWVVESHVVDQAGNRTDLPPLTVKVDTTPPTLALHVDPSTPDGDNGWYVTAPVVAVEANDEGSGVTDMEVSADGGQTWETYDDTKTPTLSDGLYHLMARAWDTAGNEATITGPTVRVDTTPPTLLLDAPDVLSCVSRLRISANDDTSGLREIAWYRQETWAAIAHQNGVFDVEWDVRTLPAGEYEARFRALDAAGNAVEMARTFTVRHPEIGIGLRPRQGYFWDVFRVDVVPRCMQITRIRAVVENPDGPEAVLGDWDTTSWERYKVEVKWDGTFPGGAAGPGTYWLRVDVWDTSGRVVREWVQVVMPSFAPTATASAPSLPTSTPTPTPTARPATPTPTSFAPAHPVTVVVATPTVTTEPSVGPIARPAAPPAQGADAADDAWAAGLLASILAALGLLASRDPRTPEIARGRELLREMRNLWDMEVKR